MNNFSYPEWIVDEAHEFVAGVTNMNVLDRTESLIFKVWHKGYIQGVRDMSESAQHVFTPSLPRPEKEKK